MLGGPKWSRWPIAGLILWFCAVSWEASTRALEPGEPQQAFFVALIIFIVILVLSELLRPKPEFEDARPGGIGDFTFPTATEGRVVPLLFGQNRFDGPNVIWYGDIAQRPITEKVKTGLWSSTSFIKGYEYDIGVQFGFCRGDNVELHEITIDNQAMNITPLTADGRVDIDESTLFDKQGGGGIRATCDFYQGSRTQLVNEYLNVTGRQKITPVEVGHTATCPRYTNVSHLVVRQLTGLAPTAGDTGAYFGNSTSIKAWRFEIARFPSLFPSQIGAQNKIGKNCNPINILFEILTNTEWGLSFSISDIDLVSFQAASDTMIAESNGMSIVLDRPQDTLRFMAEVERQIDGLTFVDQNTGKWVMKLARADYVVGNLPLFDRSKGTWSDYTKGSWRDTTNQIQVKFRKREDEYKESYVIAQDMGNVISQGFGTVATGRVITSVASYPGVKDAALAANIAWRDLRTLAYPLARAVFKMDREFWALTPVDVFRWTAPELDIAIVDLPMRVTTVDYGTLQKNVITVHAVQDVFGFVSASFGSPPPTKWGNPFIEALPFIAAEQIAIEAPRAILVREPSYSGDPAITKVFCSARRRGGESQWKVIQRHAAFPSAPTGSYADAGDSIAFMLIGDLSADIASGTAIPTAAITLKSSPDSQANILAAFQAATIADMGVDLANLVLVGTEFMLVTSTAANATEIDLESVYRGVLDSAQENHLEDDPVFLIHVGGTLAGTLFSNRDNIEIKLIPETRDDAVTEIEATTIALTTDKRSIRPYPPSAPTFNALGVAYGPASLEGQGSTLDNFRLDIGWLRRRFDNLDEITQLLADQTDIDVSTEYEVELRFSPFGGGDVVETKAFVTGNGDEQFLRTAIIAASDTDADEDLQVRITARHDIGAETNLESRSVMIFAFTPTTGLAGQTYMGQNTWSNNIGPYTAVATENHTVTIGVAYSTANVEHRINGGGWTDLITASATSAVVALNNTDTLELRIDADEQVGSGGNNFIEVKNNASTSVAYGIFN
jgi:hypothetical protein